jgi:hypothetical protein
MPHGGDMKLGPIHVVTDATMAIMQGMIHRFAAELAQEKGRQLESLKTALHPQLLHPCVKAKYAPPWHVEPDIDDAESRQAVRRVLSAYQRARREHQRAAPCLWEINEQNCAKSFIDALDAADEEALFEHLRSMFRRNTVFGLGCVCEQVWRYFHSGPLANYQLHFTDLLVALAEAVGAQWLSCVEQNAEGFFHALDVDLAEVFGRVEHRIGLDLTFPSVGGAYGCVLNGRRLTVDSITHAYTANRMAELGAKPGDSITEIGGGYGCLALLMHRAGFVNYTIYDLPWVNALQGYFLIKALPPGSVRLFGEDSGSLSILPGWRFDQLADRSVDYVVNTNSLPELGAKTAAGYLQQIGRTTRKLFLSINQEARVAVGRYGPQLCVAELAERQGGFRRISRTKYWMRNGYVEEVYAPKAA